MLIWWLFKIWLQFWREIRDFEGMYKTYTGLYNMMYSKINTSYIIPVSHVLSQN